MKRLREMARLNFLLTNSFKANCTFLLSLIAIAMFVINPSREQEICMYAILTSTLADLILMNYNNIPIFLFKKNYFYVGMATFAITHILYSCCFFEIISVKNLNINDILVSFLIINILFIILINLLRMIAYKKSDVFKIASVLYMTVINVAIFSIYASVELYGEKYILAAIGITMFLISDIFILIRETVRDTPLIRKLIWIFYPIGQLLIISSV